MVDFQDGAGQIRRDKKFPPVRWMNFVFTPLPSAKMVVVKSVNAPSPKKSLRDFVNQKNQQFLKDRTKRKK